jgi:branched-chain amino acid transport system ATP-binding protein
LLRAIYGTNRWFSGQIIYRGEEIQRLDPATLLRRGIGFVPQGRCNFPAMSVAENLLLGCYILPRALHRERLDAVGALFPMLGAKRGLAAGNLSGGEQQILETAMVMLTAPALLLLDEPSLGLSPIMQAQVFAEVRRIADTGVTVLMVEQNVQGALMVSNRAIVMELGRVFLEGQAEAVRDDPRIRDAYLGGNIKEVAC